MGDRLMLLDSASMYFRAFYGVPDRFEAPDGTPVNAVRGFLDAIATLLTEYQPDQLVACWDNDWRPQFRVDLVPSYKAHRVVEPSTNTGAGIDTDTDTDTSAEEIPERLEVQVPVMVEMLAAAGLARIGADGFEADDVIAALARDSAGPTLVVTGDRDLFQLVDPAKPVRVLYTAKGLRNVEVVDDTWLVAKYGVTGRQYADFSLMRGDSSDGLPGVVGVGEKTAAKLLEGHGDLAGIMAAAEDPTSDIGKSVRTKLLDSRDYLKRAAPVVTLNHPVPLPSGPFPVPRQPADPQRLAGLADSYELNTPLQRITNALGWNWPI